MNDDTASRGKRLERFLRDRDAHTLDHPGGTLLAHLNRVADTLAAWGGAVDLQLAGLAHAVYGTDGFGPLLVELSDRPIVVKVIGERAEALVYLYASCDRAATYPGIDNSPVIFRDRFTGKDFQPADADLRAFLELTAANELDVLAHNAELAALHGAALHGLFSRVRAHLSPAAWQACQAQLSR